jgi:predicted lipoprotein with Yx(FWY)xxD motif
MTRRTPITFLAGAAVIPLAALAVAGCGNSNSGATASPAHPKTIKKAPPTTVKVAHSGLGQVLVDSQGRTLYLFTKDSGTTSACTGACATAWPPLRTTGKPIAGSGASASLVGSTTRADGTSQATYNGHPLYLFVKDTKPGDTNGEGVTAFGGSWFAVSATGKQVSPKASKSGGGSATTTPAAPPAPKAAPPAPKPAPPAPKAAPPAPKAAPAPQSNGIPQGGGGDGDADNNGGPSDGDGGL